MGFHYFFYLFFLNETYLLKSAIRDLFSFTLTVGEAPIGAFTQLKRETYLSDPSPDGGGENRPGMYLTRV